MPGIVAIESFARVPLVAKSCANHRCPKNFPPTRKPAYAGTLLANPCAPQSKSKASW